MTALPIRTDYPRPQFERTNWLNLNGPWEFEYDDRDEGERAMWYDGHPFSRSINVPFCFQSKLSGVNETGFHDIVWYRKKVTLPAEYAGKRVLLHFGAVDYLSWVWVNGVLVKQHAGGHTPFYVEITNALRGGENEITVKAQDFSTDLTLPRGKQFWKERSEGIFYTRTTGIWQTVWIEAVSDVYLEKVKYTPDIDAATIGIRSYVGGLRPGQDVKLRTVITFEGQPISDDTFKVTDRLIERQISTVVPGIHNVSEACWWPGHPKLYDVKFMLYVDGHTVDEVSGYFGMRKVSVMDGQLCLNNQPYKMRMVLDQGYFPEGLLTAPSDEALRQDVELTKAMGFNGARKHQKIEDPRYLYWADKLGLIVWGEMANAYLYSDDYAHRMTSEWMEAVERDYNHPCIVAWVPINESWGVPRITTNPVEQYHAMAMYYVTKQLDPMRPVITNDGWEHVLSDIVTIHDYESRREVLEKRYSSEDAALSAKPANKWITVPGFPHEGKPIHVSEFGGISFKKSDWEGWGYSAAKDDQDFVAKLAAVIHPLLQSPIVQGYCYTQLTDVEQEINGLLTYDRKPKVPLEWIKQINEGKVPVVE